MLRTSRGTLQPEKDTRRLAPMSMKRGSQPIPCVPREKRLCNHPTIALFPSEPSKIRLCFCILPSESRYSALLVVRNLILVWFNSNEEDITRVELTGVMNEFLIRMCQQSIDGR